MAGHFALTIRLLDQRYHGAGEWPPAPARVFQALVAGAARGRHIAPQHLDALEVLEKLGPPVIAAPAARLGQRVALYVPNNDLDSVGGDPRRVEKVRTKKTMQPHLLEGDPAFLYAWSLDETAGDALLPLADGVCQLGRGVDPAWATGELIDDAQLDARLRAHRGTVHRPADGEGSTELAVPTRNSLASLMRRFDAMLDRLRPSDDRRRTNFVQPPKAQFEMVRYGGAPAIHLFALLRESDPTRSSAWSAWRASSLVERVRDTAVAALSEALPDRRGDIERALAGRTTDGVDARSSSERVRFVPLPSIGHAHADYAIRRVLVHVPPAPVTQADVLWALAGRRLFDPTTGELSDTTLSATPADDMVARYCRSARTWRSVTPLALASAPRRRIDPARVVEEAKSAGERQQEERTARHAVSQALRHAGIRGSLVHVHVQREPFEAHGVKAERFAAGTRFPKETLWHVEIELDREVSGPLVLGDGRFLGLGVMAPKAERGVIAIDVEDGLPDDVDVTGLARALRRAVMARVQAVLGVRGEEDLPAYFHGHGVDGEPLREDRSTHLAFAVDVRGSRLLIVPPHVLDRWSRPLREDANNLEVLDRALADFSVLRAGHAGLLNVRVGLLMPSDPLLRTARTFESASDYVVTRHGKRSTVEDVVKRDIERECERRRLPQPTVQVSSARGVPGLGVVARVRVTFAVAVEGPILLGKTRYLGGGLMRPAEGREADTCKSKT
jgi:CRISPR-associated protein Csb2